MLVNRFSQLFGRSPIAPRGFCGWVGPPDPILVEVPGCVHKSPRKTSRHASFQAGERLVPAKLVLCKGVALSKKSQKHVQKCKLYRTDINDITDYIYVPNVQFVFETIPCKKQQVSLNTKEKLQTCIIQIHHIAAINHALWNPDKSFGQPKGGSSLHRSTPTACPTGIPNIC